MKKLTSMLLALALVLSLAACGGAASSSVASSAASSEAVPEAASEAASSEEAKELSTTDALRIAGLKGPTTMGLVNLLSMEEDGTASMDYDLQLYGAADEIVPLLMKGELDMAAIPANLAATLYQKTEGGIQAVAVNTLGVLYVVEKGGDTIQSMADLAGRTILSTGKGTTPEYVLRYLLNANGIDPDKDVTIEYYSEATEVTAQMVNTEDAIAVLPQPYVTAAGLQDDTLRVALDLTEEWNKVADTQLITGVTVVRKEYAEEHPDVVAAFLTDYAKSVEAANTDLDGTAALCEEQGVVAKAAIAKKALPNCNIVCLTGDELKTNASADGSDITGVSFPVKVLTPWALKNAKQATDADSYDITVTLKGKESTTTYTGADALFENESYAYYNLSETPAYYITAWYNLLSGKWEFGKVHATETTVEGTTVELNTNGHHTTYEMKISGFDLDYKANKVYGVVLTTADGSEYGLHHVTNIWHGTKLGFNADDSYFASIIGKTVTQITFYAADGVYVLPVNVAL